MSESDFDSAWRAFADADARVRAPDRIRHAVMAAWDGPREVRGAVRSRHRDVVRAALAVAATMAITVAWFHFRDSHAPVRDADVAVSRSARPPSVGADDEPDRVATVAHPEPVRSSPRVVRRAPRVLRDVISAETPLTGGSAPLVALTGERALAAEPLQLVRVRVPRTSLRAFGVALIDPDASGLVDVDLVVGSDGLPRDIRRVRPVVDVRDQSMESP